MVAVSPCRSDMSARGLAPWAHLADGRLTLMLVRDCSRLQYLRFLAAIPRAGAPASTPPPPPLPGVRAWVPLHCLPGPPVTPWWRR